MQSWKRLLNFILLNVVVSALTTWLVVTLMLNRYPQATLLQPVPDLSGESQGQDEPAGGGNGRPDETSIPGSQVIVLPGQMEVDSIIGAGDVENERIVVKHVGQEEISLANWQLKDEDGNLFTFPSLTMFSGGAVTVYSRVGLNTVVELFWGLDQPVWEEGEQASLLDPNGNIQAVYTVP